MRYHRTHRQISQSNFKDIKSQSHTNTKAQNIEGYTTVFKIATNYIQNYPISMKYYNWFSHSEPFMYYQYSSWTHQYFFRNQNLFATQREYTTSLSKISSIGKTFSSHHHVPHSKTNEPIYTRTTQISYIRISPRPEIFKSQRHKSLLFPS